MADISAQNPSQARKRQAEGSLEKQPPSFLRPQSVAIVHVGKGDQKESFSVYKEFLCYHSPYFNAAFNGNFIEGQSQELILEDVDPKTFGALLSWVYSKTLDINGGADAMAAIHLWLLADRVLVPRLQNAALRYLNQARMGTGRLPSAFLRAAYENTIRGSPLRRYVVDSYTIGAVPRLVHVDDYHIVDPDTRVAELMLGYDRYPTEFLVDVFDATRNLIEDKNLDREYFYYFWNPTPKELEKYYVSEGEVVGNKRPRLESPQADEGEAEEEAGSPQADEGEEEEEEEEEAGSQQDKPLMESAIDSGSDSESQAP